MKNKIPILLAVLGTSLSAQEIPQDGSVMMINPKAPEAVNYISEGAGIFIGLEADGTRSFAHSFVCSDEALIPSQTYHEAEELLDLGCRKLLYDDPE